MERKEEFIPFEQVEHTADLAYVVRGRSLEELFENAGAGLTSFLVDPCSIHPLEETPIECQGADPEELLVAWLQEILYLEEVHRRLFRSFRVRLDGETLVRGTGLGERLDPARHEILTDIKAATYHDLKITRSTGPFGALFTVRIVLDL
jgi:SHS2 domain-containing protein